MVYFLLITILIVYGVDLIPILSCRVINTLGSVRVSIKLQTKGPPEKPEALHATDVGPRHVLLEWVPGFDGGLKNTKYFVSYKKVLRTNDNEIDNDCYATKRLSSVGESWQEFDCQVNNPCNVTSLEQHQTYVFKVRITKSYNLPTYITSNQYSLLQSKKKIIT